MTDKSITTGTGLGDLDQVLERFGSDRTRWPAPVRKGFAGLLAESPEAQIRLREAEALDRLLDLMPQPVVDTRALSDRIMAAALGEPVRALPSKAPASWQSRLGGSKRAAGASRAYWPAAAVLAASLVLGMFSGLSGAFDTTVGTLVAETSYGSDAEIDPGQIALDSDQTSLFEEDFL